MAAIEVKLRQLQFRQHNVFVPTAHQMTLNEHAFYEAMRGDELKHYPGEYAEIAYSIKELCTELEKFVASKSPTGAAAIGASGRGGGQSERRRGRGHGRGHGRGRTPARGRGRGGGR